MRNSLAERYCRAVLVRWRPRVLISSSIRDFKETRVAVQRAVEELHLADAWLFETSSEASGTGPSEQYLQAARDSDIVILIVTSEVRQGTIDEYHAAIADNPRKVLPYLLGSQSNSTANFRDELHRHTIVPVENETELVSRIASGIRHHLETGEIARRSLVEQVQQLRDQARLDLGMPTDFGLERELATPGQTSPPESLAEAGRRAFLLGLGGSGKTDVALTALAGTPLLPIYVRAGQGRTDVEGLVFDAFRSVRFDPGPALLRQYLSDGRLALVVDGSDDLSPEDRDRLFDAVDGLAASSPRSAVVVLGRVAPAGRLDSFERVELTPLSSNDLELLFQAFGYDPGAIRNLDRRLADLAVLPFWAALIAQFGQSVGSGLALLQRLVETRFERALPIDELRRIRAAEALGALALRLRPASEIGLALALDHLQRWVEGAADRYAIMPAVELLDEGRRTGLISVIGNSVRFLHPLVASYLAAASAMRTDPVSIDPADLDVAAMVAAFAEQADPTRTTAILCAGGLGVLSTYLRITGIAARTTNAETDLSRFDTAAESIWRTVFGAHAEPFTTRMLRSGTHVCLLREPGPTPSWTEAADIRDWVSPADDEVEITCWQHDPFARMSPERLAARWVLDAFKRRVVATQPLGHRFAPFGTDPREIATDRPRLERELIEHVRAQAAARSSFLTSLRVRDSEIAPYVGEPLITVRITARDVRYTVEWRHDTAAVTFVEGAEEWVGRSVPEIRADPVAVAFHDLKEEIEHWLGSPVSTQSERPLSPFAWSL